MDGRIGGANQQTRPHTGIGLDHSRNDAWLEIQAAFAFQGKVRAKTKKAPNIRSVWSLFQFNPGSDLRSHAVTRAVSSAQRGLTSVFGMGTGVTLVV